MTAQQTSVQWNRYTDTSTTPLSGNSQLPERREDRKEPFSALGARLDVTLPSESGPPDASRALSKKGSLQDAKTSGAGAKPVTRAPD